MTEREIYEKFDNLSEEELNTNSFKNIYVRNDVMIPIIKRCRGEKKKGIRTTDGFRKKKLMISDSGIPKCPEFEVKSKIGKLFMNEKISEECSVRIYEIDRYFYEHHKEKIKVDKNGREYILFKIDVYFTEYFLAIEVNGQNHEDRDLVFEKKRQEALDKKLGCMFIRINTSDAKREFMIQTIKLVKYKYLSVNLKKKQEKKKKTK